MQSGAMRPMQVDIRFWQLAKQMGIQRLEDVFAELVTNANDAYDRLERIVGTRVTNRFLGVDVYGMNASRVVVTDRATGMSSADMERCLAQVGAYTAQTFTLPDTGSPSDDAVSNLSTTLVRGYFSRGAKDVTTVGEVTYESICQGVYNKFRMTQRGMVGFEVRDAAATDDDRARLQLPENGVVVTVQVSRAYQVPDVPMLNVNLINSAALRDIMADPNNDIEARWFADDAGTTLIRAGRVAYQWPEVAETVFDKEYTVPAYPGVQARFVLYRCAQKLPEPTYDSELQYGILVRSEKTIHEVTTLRPEWRYHVAMPYLYGSIRCSYIMQLMQEIETFGPTEANPFAVLDPARKGGINVDHPFIRQLYSVPQILLGSYLPIVSDLIEDSFMIQGNVQSLIQNLEVFGSELLTADDAYMVWQNDEQGSYLRALRDIEQNYVRSELDTHPLHETSPTPNGPDAPAFDPDQQPFVTRTDQPSDTYDRLQVLATGTLVPPPPPVTDRAMPQRDDPAPNNLIAKVAVAKPLLRIKFSQIDNPAYAYNVYRTRAEVTLILHLKYKLVAQYFPITDGQVTLTHSNATFLSDVLAESLTRLLLDADATVRELKFVGGGTPTEYVHQVFAFYERRKSEIDILIDNHVRKQIETFHLLESDV